MVDVPRGELKTTHVLSLTAIVLSVCYLQGQVHVEILSLEGFRSCVLVTWSKTAKEM